MFEQVLCRGLKPFRHTWEDESFEHLLNSLSTTHYFRQAESCTVSFTDGCVGQTCRTMSLNRSKWCDHLGMTIRARKRVKKASWTLAHMGIEMCGSFKICVDESKQWSCISRMCIKRLGTHKKIDEAKTMPYR